MEDFALHTGSPTVHWEVNTSFVYFVEAKIVTPRVKHVDIPIYFLQEIFDNGLFFPIYEKSSSMLTDMCEEERHGHNIKYDGYFMVYIGAPQMVSPNKCDRQAKLI